ncbi:MAG TPA: PASTA domain-containing protein [Vicinamibacterales bacterium]|nr:PASTA domain-containing protein [Vicinamibacterales bacterium]
MALKTRVWSAGKLLLLGGALLLTYVLFAAASMRLALKTREVEVPSLAGRTVNEARTLVAETGLNLRVEEALRIDPKVPAGQVVAQSPEAGIRTRSERTVKVWVSAGPRATVMPSLIGESERTAHLRLEQEGLRLAAASEVRSADYPSGAIVAQTPPPKAAATQVALLINRGERGLTFVMPDLIGVNGDRASDLLRARGFRVAVVGDHPYPGVPAGIVLRQNPQAGFQISPGETISLEVSR